MYIILIIAPIVFHTLRDDKLFYAGNLNVKFEPELVTVNNDGYFYYPFEKALYYPQDELREIKFKNVNNQVLDWGIHEYLQELELLEKKGKDGNGFGLLKSSLVLNELAGGLEHEYFVYKNKKFPFNWI